MLRPVSSHRERVLFARYQRDGDLAARGELVEGFLPLAHALARRHATGAEPLDDLHQVASLALVKAIDRFEPDRGVRFTSYAVPTIVGELRRHFRNTAWAVHVPRDVQERALAVNRTVERLSASRGASPTAGEIAAEMGLATEDVLEAMIAGAGQATVSLDAPAGAGDGPTIADAVGAPDERFDLAEAKPLLRDALERLPNRDRSILYLRFARDLTQIEIAEHLGISQMHVSRLLRGAIESMRVAVDTSP